MKYEYKDLELYKQLHQQRSYGDTGSVYTDDVRSFIDETGSVSVLDFGAGRGSLKSSLHNKYSIDIDEFDPCIPDKEIIPKEEYELVITTDLLEHLFEEEIDNLFEEILSLKPKFMYHAISTRTATILLPDGSNCHKTVKNTEWWSNRIKSLLNPKSIEQKEINDDCVIFKIKI
jgi:2-polyprenyl-3-methyl-5-hydroxy-6-metoxy-1,4-benzoquinol methylase